MKKIIFFGSSHHCLVTLNALHNDGSYVIVAVVTQPPKPVGRKQIVTPTAVEEWALQHGVEVIKPVSWKKELSGVERQSLAELNAQVGVLSNYGKILPQSVIDLFPEGIINLHPSLLPKYRGPAPAVGVILNGDEVSGTCIMLLSAEMDAGPILGTVAFPVKGDETPETYYEKGFRLGTQKLLAVLPAYLNGELEPQEQDHAKATYTKMLTKEDGRIDWTMSAIDIDRHVRAYTPWPGTWTEIQLTEDQCLLLPNDMLERTGTVSTMKEHTPHIQIAKTLRLKIIDGIITDTTYTPMTVQVEGEMKQSWENFVKRLC